MANLRLPSHRLSVFDVRHARAGCLLVIGCLLLVLGPVATAVAEDLTSPNYRHRAGTFSASVATGLTSSAVQPEVGGASASVGSSIFGGASGSSITLASILDGFWAIAAGAFPSLDIDDDLAQFFLDDDDDGDGLLDVHETGTGIFVSALNTGSSPVAPDSDGDGFSDGAEVEGGTDPNDEQSFPAPNPAVPSLHPGSLVLLLVFLWIVMGQSNARLGRGGRRHTAC